MCESPGKATARLGTAGSLGPPWPKVARCRRWEGAARPSPRLEARRAPCRPDREGASGPGRRAAERRYPADPARQGVGPAGAKESTCPRGAWSTERKRDGQAQRRLARRATRTRLRSAPPGTSRGSRIERIGSESSLSQERSEPKAGPDPEVVEGGASAGGLGGRPWNSPVPTSSCGPAGWSGGEPAPLVFDRPSPTHPGRHRRQRGHYGDLWSSSVPGFARWLRGGTCKPEEPSPCNRRLLGSD